MWRDDANLKCGRKGQVEPEAHDVAQWWDHVKWWTSDERVTQPYVEMKMTNSGP